jgi:hypothetical protein
MFHTVQDGKVVVLNEPEIDPATMYAESNH